MDYINLKGIFLNEDLPYSYDLNKSQIVNYININKNDILCKFINNSNINCFLGKTIFIS